MKLLIKQTFDYWHSGCNRSLYQAGQEVDATDAEMAIVAVSEGWAVPIEKADKPTSNKARKAAPENK